MPNQEDDVSPGTLEESTKIIYHVLYSRDFNVVYERLARIQFEHDLSRFRASQQRLLAAMVSLKESQQKTTTLREGMDETDFNEMASRHRQAFMHTHLYQVARPYLEGYYISHHRHVTVGD